MFEHQIVPSGEHHMHTPVEECACNPRVKRVGNGLVLMHRSFDHRELWLGIEMMLGHACQEHGLWVSDLYRPGAPNHRHLKKPEPLFEYDHIKIDPR